MTAGVRRYCDDRNGMGNRGGQIYWDDQDGLGSGCRQGYGDDDDRLGNAVCKKIDSAKVSIYSGDSRVDRLPYHPISSYHTRNYALHLSHYLISLALSGTPCGSTQLHGSSQPGSIIPFHPLCTLLNRDPLFLTNFLY